MSGRKSEKVRYRVITFSDFSMNWVNISWLLTGDERFIVSGVFQNERVAVLAVRTAVRLLS